MPDAKEFSQTKFAYENALQLKLHPELGKKEIVKEEETEVKKEETEAEQLKEDDDEEKMVS